MIVIELNSVPIVNLLDILQDDDVDTYSDHLDDDDSNDESNWRNDYPDDDCDDSSSSSKSSNSSDFVVSLWHYFASVLLTFEKMLCSILVNR